MKASRDKDISYEVVRSRRSTADIVVERNGKVVVRAPATFPDERIDDIVEAKRYWIYKTLAEWRDLNATRVLREYRNGEGFLYLGRAYRLRLVTKQKDLVALRDGYEPSIRWEAFESYTARAMAGRLASVFDSVVGAFDSRIASGRAPTSRRTSFFC